MMRFVRTSVCVSVLVLTIGSVVVAAPPVPPSGPAGPVYAPPVPHGYPATYVVQPGDTLTRIAVRYGTTVWAIAQTNGIRNVNYIRIGQVLLIPYSSPVTPVPSSCPRSYVVQLGDTLTKIAWRFGVSTWGIVQANGIWNPNYIQVGQVLLIPC